MEAGVVLEINQGVSILNEGRLIVEGTKNNPVIFNAVNDSSKWGYINTPGTFIAENLHVYGATRFIYCSGGDTVIINHCIVDKTSGTIGDDCIGIHDAKKVLILNSSLTGNPDAGKIDAIDCDGITDDTISGNFITAFADDGIDIGTYSKNIVLNDNIITHCDMGLSVGESSTAKADGNLLLFNVGGIQSHYGSVVTARQNTLHGNRQGLRLFHNTGETSSGGTLIISNSIISGSWAKFMLTVPNSVSEINYCLSDSAITGGVGNILSEAGFVSIEEEDFRLNRNSNAIDAGDPDGDSDGIDYTTDIDDMDPDGTRKDLGCYPFYQSSLRIIEIAPSNLSIFPDDSGEYTDWFKIYNESEEAINLQGYFLSDNPGNPEKFSIPAGITISSHDTLVFRASDEVPYTPYHVDFKLSGDGEYLSISNAAGIILDEKEFPWVPVNYVYKRIGTTETWVFSEWPVNDTAKQYAAVCDRPEFNPPGGSVSFPISLSVLPANAEDTVLVSMDGANPEDPLLYPDILTVSEALTARSKTVREGLLPSYTHAHSYFSQDAYKLPVISFSADHEDLFVQGGIYYSYAKEGPLFEIPASVAYYNGNNSFDCITGARIQGGNSVYMPKKSFRFHYRGGYGQARLEANIFKGGPTSFKNLVIRSGYDDDITTGTGTMLRDPFSNELWKGLGELATGSEWSVLLLNGQYWGIYNLRESINEYFVEDHYGLKDFDLVRFQKWGPDLKYGTWDSWDELTGLFNSTDFSLPESYDKVAAVMDMNSFLNLLSFVHVTQFRSWTWGAFMVKPEKGKWKWTIWDTDRSYLDLSWNGFTEYAITSAEKWPNFMPQRLLANERFRHELINRNCDLLNSIMIPDNAIAVYDSLVDILVPEIDAEYQRWNPGNRARWDTNNEAVRNFLRSRPVSVYNQMKSYFSIEDTITVKVNIVGNGKVRVNSLKISKKTWKGIYMQGIPIELEALPDYGATFIEWQDISSDHSINFNPEDYRSITAVFDSISVEERTPLMINEIMYNPFSQESSEWVEFYNPNEFTVSLEGYTLSDGGLANKFVFPYGSLIDPKDYLVVAGDFDAYGAEFGQQKLVKGSFNDGSSGFNLSNAGEAVILINELGEQDDRVDYRDSYPWPVFADGVGPSLQLKALELDNTLPENWFADTETESTPARKNSSYSSVEEVSGQSGIFVFPNPVREELHILLPGEVQTDIQLAIFTLSGQKIAVDMFHRNGRAEILWNHGIDVSGMYILRVSYESAGSTRAFSSLIVVENP